jgi:hypothetical protein
VYTGVWWENLREPGKTRCIWEDNTELDVQVVEWEGVDWIYLAQDRDRWRALVNALLNLRVQFNSGNFLTS